MPRSHSEIENVQFVQELAEVDGPFESPININFRDLTKLELPSLLWNRSDASPSKMKITNTGHTVIISGKWRSERPYLTGGPLIGKYVFSQIHFHWGQNDSSGSEHLVSGEGFPLEMHVAHFKTDYHTQENALREKDGMVVLVYLFKIQEEPNNCLRKIINALPNIKRACTSRPLDPIPILGLCNPFTDDYFMYWGSVVTPTCAHILLWLVCREPFGISKEQVNEFRQLLDSSQTPICSNYRNPQPLHKRNVFHVNSSRNLDTPLLPIKKMVGCYCSKLGEETKRIRPTTTSCACQVYPKNQEEIEENDSEGYSISECMHENAATLTCEVDVEQMPDCYTHSVYVQRATIQSMPLLPDAMQNLCLTQNCKNVKPKLNNQLEAKSKLLSQSCGFIPAKEFIRTRRTPIKGRELVGPINSKTAFSHFLESLETLKSETCKKLKEIETINREIKGLTFFCQNSEDRKWLQKVEKLMARQKQITLNASQGCYNELKKLARECHFDKFFDGKILSVGDNNNEIIWFNNIITHQTLPCSQVKGKGDHTKETPSKIPKKGATLIQSFFEDIQENEDLQPFEKEIRFQRKNAIFQDVRQAGDVPPGNMERKVYITQKMFALGNFGDRFFTEVAAEEILSKPQNTQQNNEIQLNDEKEDIKKVFLTERKSSEILSKNDKSPLPVIKIKTEEIIPLHRANVAIKFSDVLETEKESNSNLLNEANITENYLQGNFTEDRKSPLEKYLTPSREKKSNRENAAKYFIENLKKKDNRESAEKKSLKSFNQSKFSNSRPSTSTRTFNLMEAQKMILANMQKKQQGKDALERKQSKSIKYSYKRSSEKANKKQKFRNATLEEFDFRKKKLQNRNKKSKKGKKTNEATNPSDVSSSSNDDAEEVKSLASGKLTNRYPINFTLEKSSSSHESGIVYSPISPERKKLKLESKQLNRIGNSGKNEAEEESFFELLKKNDKSTLRDPFQKILQNSSRMHEARPTILLAKEDKTVQKNINIKIVTNKFENNQQVYKVSSPNSSKASGDSTNRILKPGSYGSKTSSGDAPDVEKILEEPYGIFRAEKLTNRMEQKFSRNKSFTNLSLLHFSTRDEITRRAFIENVDDRRKSARETFELRRDLRNIKVLESDEQGKARNPCKPPLAFYKKAIPDENKKEQTSSPEKTDELDLEALLNSKEFWNSKKFIPTHFQEGLFKSKIKRCNIEKYHFLENELQESKAVSQNSSAPPEKQNQEVISKTESNKSFIVRAPNMRGDSIAPTVNENKKASPPVSFAAIKKNPTSRPHSAESLTSMKKVNRRKTKKRPHCCKRNSGHYMKKNSCVFKKLNKAEVKSTQLLNLSEKEQLKIITENVAKYLKNKLTEHQLNNKPEKKCSFKMIEVVLQDLKTPEQKAPNPSSHEVKKSSGSDIPNKEENREIVNTSSCKEEKPPLKTATKSDEKNEKHKESPSTIKKVATAAAATTTTTATTAAAAACTTKPVHNFIKRNKLMAGKYKRTLTTTQKKEDTTDKKKIELKKNKISQGKEEKEVKSRQNSISYQKPPAATKGGKEIVIQERQFKNQGEIKKSNLEKDKDTIKKAVCTAADDKKKIVKKNQQFSLSLQKITPGKKRWVQPIMLTSYLSGPIGIIGNESKKMSRYLMNVKKTNTDPLRQEKFYEDKSYEKPRNKDTIFATDLEYLIRLQMCLNNEISANIENSMNYIKTLLNPEYNGSAIVEKAPLNDQINYYNSNKQGVVLIEMNDVVDYSSSGSEFAEERESKTLKITEANSKSQSLASKDSRASKSSKSQSITSKESRASKSSKSQSLSSKESRASKSSKSQSVTSKKSRASKSSKMDGLSEKIISKMTKEMAVEDDYYSDSSYNCEISITLNTKELEEKGEGKPSYEGELSPDDFGNNAKFDEGGETNSSRTTTNTPKDGGSSSQSIQSKPTRKKRKENQISAEMKQKLLEILEKEIKREMGGAAYITSSENSSDGLALTWDESDVMIRSHHSAESGSENTEILAQISETMRQYLREFKVRKMSNCDDGS